jgi:peptide/nickel transport system permease protein
VQATTTAGETITRAEGPSRVRRSASVGLLLLRRNPLGALGLVLLLIVVGAALLADVVAPYSADDTRSDSLSEPSASHPFGTDRLGRDVLSRVIYGARVSLAVGFGSVATGLLAGAAIGIASGYVGGLLDSLLQRITDVLLAFPLIILAIFIASVSGPGLWKSIIVLGVAITPAVARVVRSSVLSERERDYVLSARSVGASEGRIMLFHLLPNVSAPIVVLGTTLLSVAILAEASLSFLGVGVPPSTASWGGDLSGSSRDFFEIAPWMAIFPGLALTVTVLGLNFFGDALRDVLDPRLQRDMLRRNV